MHFFAKLTAPVMRTRTGLIRSVMMSVVNHQAPVWRSSRFVKGGAREGEVLPRLMQRHIADQRELLVIAPIYRRISLR